MCAPGLVSAVAVAALKLVLCTAHWPIRDKLCQGWRTLSKEENLNRTDVITTALMS